MKLYLLIECSLLLVAGLQEVKAQKQSGDTLSEERPATKLVSANDKFDKAGKVKRLLLGQHFRKVWSTQVEVPTLYLDAIYGGLTPVKVGGGKQTKSLRLASRDGKEYVLRSINKDPSKAIPRELVGTFADDVVQDQICSSNPYAPMVVAALTKAAHIYHTTPVLYYIPHQKALGAYNDEFANTLCLLEERPSGSEKDNPEFDHSDKIVNSAKLFEKVFGNAKYRVDERAFLKARLFDIWIGDWDRHEDQWLWAAFEKEGGVIYRPIPRDRDQAFSKLDGILPTLATKKWAVRRTQNFGYHLHDVVGIAITGIVLDRSFMTGLDWKDWAETARQLQHDLTDAMIEKAFLDNMPPAIYALSARVTIEKLKSRRDDLLKYAATYYHFLSRQITIVGTDNRDHFVVNRDKKTTSVVIYPDGKMNKPFFERTFQNSETKEIRLYGLKGEDRFDIAGRSGKGILLRVIGGRDSDVVSDQSHVNNWGHRTRIYDDDEHPHFSGNRLCYHYSTDSVKNVYNKASHFRNYDYLAPQIAPGYNPDDGIYLGGGILFKKQSFGKSPYGSQHVLKANYAFATGAYNFWYEGIFNEAVGKWALHLNVIVNAPNYALNYFGAGNETELITTDKNYNRVRSNRISFIPSLSRKFNVHHAIELGITTQTVKVEKSMDRFVADTRSGLDSGVFTRKYYSGARFAYRFNNTDDALYPRKGIRWNTVASFTQNLEKDVHFGTLSSDLIYYFSLGNVTAAIRAGGATNLGDGYEFFQSNNLGGNTNLRGFRRDRFSGKSCFYQNTELRWRLNSANNYLLRGNLGLLGFFDNGRVWIPAEHSDRWHYGYGGGVWFLPYGKLAFMASYGLSDEGQLWNIKAGFLF